MTAVLALAAVSAAAQETAPVLTLAKAVEIAVMSGDDRVLVEANLQAAQAARAPRPTRRTVSRLPPPGAMVPSTSANSPSVKTNTAPANPYSGTSIGAGTASVGAATTDGIFIQSPLGHGDAGTPLTTLSGSWSLGSQVWPDGSARNVSAASAKIGQILWNGVRRRADPGRAPTRPR